MTSATLDLSLIDPYQITPEQVILLKRRILELEKIVDTLTLKLNQTNQSQNHTSKLTLKLPTSTKESIENNGISSSTTTPMDTIAPTVKDEEDPDFDPTSTTSIFKRIFKHLKKEAKNENIKFQNAYGSKVVKIDEPITQEMFDTIFKGKGVLIQPTPENKPKSKVIIMRFVNISFCF
jgi:hypothetical protein